MATSDGSTVRSRSARTAWGSSTGPSTPCSWTRKTYEIARKLGQTHYLPKKNYVFSRRRRRAAPKVEFVNETAGVFARKLRAAGGKNIWMVGGADLIAAFLDAARSTSSSSTSCRS